MQQSKPERLVDLISGFSMDEGSTAKSAKGAEGKKKK
jgi:hypothetical protein